MLNEDDDDDDDDLDEDDDKSESLRSSSGGSSNKASDDLEDDITNRSLDAEDEDQLVVVDSYNYLKYISDKFNIQNDVLEVIDKHERSFKQLAEKSIQ